MTERRPIYIGLSGIAGFLSFSLLGVGLYSFWGIDSRVDPFLSTLYYVLPIASFPIFLIGRRWRRAAVLQAILAVAYVPVSAALDWRSCSSLGYCTGVMPIVFLAATTMPALAFFAAAIASCAAMVLRGQLRTRENLRQTGE